ncbi:MAG: ABC transporter ATP-binding protein [Pseudomonadota bacterium]
MSFDIRRGEVVGVIGRNGAGKSSLLRLLGGIAAPTSGSVDVKGEITTLLDLNAGLNFFQSGLRNIRNRLDMQAVADEAAKELTDQIIAFSELEDVIDRPMVTYSSGMRIRLAFAIATAMKPEVLLLDEALAVGDDFFIAKSFSRIEEMSKKGTTCFIVSHDWTKIFRLCTRVLWMEGGQVRDDGAPGKLLYPFLLNVNAFRFTKQVRIEAVRVLGNDGGPQRVFSTGAPVCIEVDYVKNPEVDSFAVILGIMSAVTGESLLSTWSMDDNVVVGVAGKERGSFRMSYSQLPLAAGYYDLNVMLAAPQQGAFPAEYHDVWGPLTHPDTKIEVRGVSPVTRKDAMIVFEPRWEIAAA